MTENGSPSPWWSIPQALVWIVMRNESKALQADSVRTIAGLRRIAGIKSVSGPEVPPVTLTAAPGELVRAWQGRRIALYGRASGKGASRSIPGGRDLSLRDFEGEVCLGEKTLYFGTRPFWTNLSVRYDDCMRCWPVMPVVPAIQGLTTMRRPSEGKVRTFIEEKRKALRGERKRAGRDVLLRAAMSQFGLPRKVLLELWNRTPRDHKGGRPRKTMNME